MKNALWLLRSVAVTLASTLRLLARKREGNVALLFGLAAIPVVIGAGIAIDTARAYMVKTRLGSALDAAALAVGSYTNQPSATLTTSLKNYFFNNYCRKVPSGAAVTSCSGTVASEGSISVWPISDITAATVTYQATATVPTTFMRLVGVDNLTVSVTAQTTKFPGMEIAVVLDNTGSMLCGANEGGNSVCGADVRTADTDCTDPSNNSRICTLRNATLQFVETLQKAITGPQSLYMAIVPFVTTVNIGPSFCSSSTNCGNHITTDATSGAFTDLRGYIIPVVAITGNTTRNGSTISTVAMNLPGGSQSGTAAIQSGMAISGPGIQPGTTVNNVNSSSITISKSATLTDTGVSLVVGASPDVTTTSSPVVVMAPSSNRTGSWRNTTSVSSVSPNTTGIGTGMYVASASSGIPAGDTVASITSSSSFRLSTAANASFTQSSKTLFISAVKGNTSDGSTRVSSAAIASGTDCAGATRSLTGSVVPGMLVSGNGFAAGTYVSAVSGTTITLSTAATETVSSNPLILTNRGGNTSNGSTTITCVSLPGVPATGTVIAGNGIQVNTTITEAPSSEAEYKAGTGTLTISRAANATNNTELNIYTPITYDSAYNTASPAGSSRTPSWGGCVIEQTSASENVSGTGVIATAGTPDTSEPSTANQWYPFYWVKDSGNNWSSSSVSRQDYTTEIQGGEQTDWLAQPGPNQGCPVPILPLTDLTTSAGQTAITDRINDMWPRSAGGTQVHVGMIWGWRTLAPNGPFAANNGHPMSYSTAQTQGWKKIVVLMTDGNNEWPATDNLTGLGQIDDGKIGTTNTSTAVTNSGARLTAICNSMAAQGYMIYTIGLGSGASGNSSLRNCPANSGFYSSATPSNLASVFQKIAASIIHLRLTR
jgi:Flp pilus assembly protein TadG